MGREGAASQMKNYEGYHDPTAGKAIRRADSSKFRRRTSRNDGGGVLRFTAPLPTRSVICRGASVPFWQNKQRG